MADMYWKRVFWGGVETDAHSHDSEAGTRPREGKETEINSASKYGGEVCGQDSGGETNGEKGSVP